MPPLSSVLFDREARRDSADGWEMVVLTGKANRLVPYDTCRPATATERGNLDRQA
jgi:hypothetical protein